MNKKRAAIIIVGAQALVYLFILVAVPALSALFFCPTCPSQQARFTVPLIIYLIPGTVGIMQLVLVWKSKNTKNEVK